MKMDFFYCYDIRLKKILTDRGIRYNCCGLHPKSMKMFWQFDNTEETDCVIKEYSKNKVVPNRLNNE